ncbi:MAG: site-specific integrase [Bacteroidetes bacterium]|nr:site-specific integrase [Bacteroidota bacterium]
MASVRLKLFKGKTLKNGEHPIVIQLIKDRKRKVISSGRSCSSDLWDDKEGMPKKQHPNRIQLTTFLLHKKKEAHDLHNTIETDRGSSYSLEEFEKKYKNENKKTSFFKYVDELVANYISIGRVGNAKIYKDTKREVYKFRNGLDLSFTDIDLQFLKKLENFFRAKGYKENTMSVFFRTLRSIFNKAIVENCVKKSLYPFDTYKVSQFDTTTQKRALSQTDIKHLIEFNPNPENPLFKSYNYFMFSFYMMGMNFHDMAFLEWDQISSEKLSYTRAKTGKHFIIKILPPAKLIIDHFKTFKDGKYVFPIFNELKHTSPQSKHNRIKKILKIYNKDLKEIGSTLEIETLLTSYVARHTWATSMKKLGASIGIISEGLGHDSEETTQIYLDSFGNDVMDKANELLLNI